MTTSAEPSPVTPPDDPAVRYKKYRAFPAVVGAPVDGDTFHATVQWGSFYGSIGSWEGRVRLARVDAAPLKNDDKSDNADGKAQAAMLASYLPAGVAVTLYSHGLDTYGRLVASVEMVDGTDLEDYLLANGVPPIGGKEFRIANPDADPAGKL